MSFLAPEASSMPRFRARKSQPTDESSEVPVRRVISPPRSRSSSIKSTSSPKQSRMSNLLNKVKAKMADHPNAVSEDHPHKPSSGVQDVPEGAPRKAYGQGGYHPDEQNVRFGSVTAENAASHNSAGTVNNNPHGVDSLSGPADPRQAVKKVEQDMSKEGRPLQ